MSKFLILPPFFLFSMGFSTCESDKTDIEINSVQLAKCNVPSELRELKKFQNQEATIRKVEYENSGKKETFYHIGVLDVPTGYLAACNLPNDSLNSFTQDGIRIRFSGTVYVPINVDLMNLNAVMVELNKLEKIVPN